MPFSSFAASSPLHTSYRHAKPADCDSPLVAPLLYNLLADTGEWYLCRLSKSCAH